MTQAGRSNSLWATAAGRSSSGVDGLRPRCPAAKTGKSVRRSVLGAFAPLELHVELHHAQRPPVHRGEQVLAGEQPCERGTIRDEREGLVRLVCTKLGYRQDLTVIWRELLVNRWLA